MRIRSYLLLLAAIVFLPGLLAAVVAVTQARQSERDAALRGLRETVRATSLLVDGQIQQSLGALTALADSPHLQTGNLAAFYAQAAAIDRRPDVWTLLLDETGVQRLNTAVPFGTPPPPPAARQRVAQVLATGKPLVSDLLVGPATGRLLTTLYVPGRPSPQGRWVVAQAFSVDHWRKTALQQPQGLDGWVVAVIDRSGKFISRSHRTQEMLGRTARPELVAAAAAADSGLIRHATLEGVESYDAFSHSALTGWTVAVAAPVASIEASATQAIVWLASGLGLALALAVGGASLLSRTLIGAMASASASARALGSGQPRAVPRTRVQEVNALNDALADAGGLLDHERSARAAAEQARELLLANERAARQLAQQENAAKDQFLALLSHELRNPLAAIGGAVEVLTRHDALPSAARGQALPASAQRFVAIIQRQSLHLRRIVDDLLEVSRLLTGKIVLDKRPLDLAACARSCVDALSMGPGAREHRLVAQVSEAWVDADPVRVEQIISNLVANALKFAPAGSNVTVSVAVHSGAAVLQVSDAGPGIEPHLLDRVFEPFFQGPPPAGRQAHGLGIGLALVRQLVGLHGGSVSASSARNAGAADDPGHGPGTTFTVTLRGIQGPTAAAATAAATAAASVAAGTGSSCRVLLVEDNADTREATAGVLRALGYSVTEAADGAAALRAAVAEPPAVVVMDLGLPGKNGLQVAAELKDNAALQHVVLLALSGYGQERDKMASRAAGFADHLVKPVLPEVLAAAIERQLAGRTVPADRWPAPQA